MTKVSSVLNLTGKGLHKMINVIGLGYIGLPTALMFASHGVEVVGTDRNRKLVDKLSKGAITFQEKGLEELFVSAIKEGICFASEYQATDMYIVAVPTPYDSVSKKVNAEYVIEAINRILDICLEGAVIIIESTISPGTIDKQVRPLIKERDFSIGSDIHLVHAPERIIPGNMLQELLHNNRTIGADSSEIGEKIKNLYASFCQGEITITDIRTAEMTKVVENTFRDINIAYANELAKICYSDNLDVHEIIRIANKHPRVNILSPGPGVGGHCISVDPWFLVGDYPGLANIILAARKINDSMPEFVLERVSKMMSEHGICDVSKIGFYGLTYKADVDDVRESPTLQLLECMKKHLAYGAKVYDPLIRDSIVDNQYYDFKRFVEDIELMVIMVGHREIIQRQELLQGKIIFDTCNVLKEIESYKL